MDEKATRTPLPTEGELVADLLELRRVGLTAHALWIDLPSLSWFARELRQIGDERPASEIIEAVLVQSAHNIDGGDTHTSAALALFGLTRPWRSASAEERRAKAAMYFQIAPDSFRRRHEQHVIEALADRMLRKASEWRRVSDAWDKLSVHQAEDLMFRPEIGDL